MSQSQSQAQAQAKSPEKTLELKELNRHTRKFFWHQTIKHPILMTLSLGLPISTIFLQTILPYYFSEAIGALTQNSFQDLQNYLIIASFVALAGLIFNIIGTQSLVVGQFSGVENLHQSLFEKIINKDVRFFVNQKVGSINSKFVDFIRAFVGLQDLIIMKSLGTILSILVGLVIVFFKSWQVGLIITVFIAILYFEIKWITKKIQPTREKRRTLRSEIFGQTADSFTNIFAIKTFVQENSELAAFKVKNKAFKHLSIKELSFRTAEGSFRIFLINSIQIIAIIIASYLISEGRLDIASVIFLLTYLQKVSGSIFSLSDFINNYHSIMIEASAMTEYLLTEDKIKDAPDAIELQGEKFEFEMKNVSFVFDDGTEKVFNGINLKIPAGQKIGLVGKSGSGKTTITQLLLRFIDVTDGEILINQQDIRQLTQASLREKISYVSQEPLLFHRSIRENIGFGKTGATDQEIEEAARQAYAWEFIEKLPNQLDTIVGERGVKLSGGQRQRIVIARAILKNAPVLILDEATSALDSESEKYIQEALENLMKNKTAIVIAHRLSTIAKLDRLLVIEEGKIIQDGNHQTLCQENGIYKSLWDHQSGGFLQE